MENKKLIIFDLDGTLVDAYAAIESSFNHVMRKLGLKPRSASVIRRAVGWGDAKLLESYVRGRNLKRALSIYRKHHEHSLLKRARLYPAARQLLRKLKARGYKLAVASNRPTRFSLILLRHLRIMEFFDYVLCADKLKAGKPHPEILNKIIRKSGVKKPRVLYAGDMVIDAQAGRRAGVKTVIVTTGSSRLAEIRRERPFKIIPRISRLYDLAIAP